MRRARYLWLIMVIVVWARASGRGARSARKPTSYIWIGIRVRRCVQVGGAAGAAPCSPQTAMSDQAREPPPSKSSKEPAAPPSKVKQSVWIMWSTLDEKGVHQVTKALQPKAQALLDRGEDGGALGVLGAVVFHLSHLMSHQVETYVAATTIDADATDVTAPPSSMTQRTTMYVLNILLIYEGPGRAKDKVKRSVASLCTDTRTPSPVLVGQPGASSSSALKNHSLAAVLKNLTATLKSCTFQSALELALLPRARYTSCWPGNGKRDLVEYLVQRQKLAEGTSDSAVMAQLGLDLLGPVRPRPQHLQPEPPKRLKLASGEGANLGEGADSG